MIKGGLWCYGRLSLPSQSSHSSKRSSWGNLTASSFRKTSRRTERAAVAARNTRGSDGAPSSSEDKKLLYGAPSAGCVSRRDAGAPPRPAYLFRFTVSHHWRQVPIYFSRSRTAFCTWEYNRSVMPVFIRYIPSSVCAAFGTSWNVSPAHRYVSFEP